MWVPAGVSFNGGRGVGSEPPLPIFSGRREPPLVGCVRVGRGRAGGERADPGPDLVPDPLSIAGTDGTEERLVQTCQTPSK